MDQQVLVISLELESDQYIVHFGSYDLFPIIHGQNTGIGVPQFKTFESSQNN